jgi:hypothetical protein
MGELNSMPGRGEDLLTAWSAVLALRRRRIVAILLLGWGLWNTSKVSHGVVEVTRCRAAW